MGEAAADPRAAPPLDWLARAAELFDAALTHAWDADHGGLYYGFGPDFTICDHNKYFWVQAETFAAAAMLGARTGSERFWDWYDEIWRYSFHFVDHRYGAWYRILTCDNRKYSDEKAGRQDRLSHDGRVLRRARDPRARATQRADAMSGGTFPAFVSAGDILTDMVRAGDAQWTSVPGGAGWNVARAVARLGVPSALALDRRRLLLRRAVAHERSGRRPALPAARRTAAAARDRPRDAPARVLFIGEASADLAFDPARLPAGWTDHVKWAHFGCISLVREPLAGTLAALAADLHARGVKISFDPNVRNLMTAAFQPTLEKMAALADLIKVSDEDLRHLFGGDGPDAIAAVRALNPRAACSSRAARRRRRSTRTATCMKRPPRVEVADTVGAGDASIGGMLFSLMAARSEPARAPRVRAGGGAAACRHTGAHAPTLDEVVALIER